MRKMRLPVSAVVLAAILALAGCGRNSSENQPAASIGGPGGAASKANAAKSDFDLKHPQVIIETSLGSITLELDGEKSPKTVENFLSYVDAGAYDQTIVHAGLREGRTSGGAAGQLKDRGEDWQRRWL